MALAIEQRLRFSEDDSLSKERCVVPLEVEATFISLLASFLSTVLKTVISQLS